MGSGASAYQAVKGASYQEVAAALQPLPHDDKCKLLAALEAVAAAPEEDSVLALFHGWMATPSDCLSSVDFCAAISALAELSLEEAQCLFDHFTVGDSGALHIDQLRQWLFSHRVPEQLLQDCQCPDGHTFNIFTPAVDGWCCQECGEDLGISRDTLQCNECDNMCWCFSCVVTTGSKAAAEITALAVARMTAEQLRPAPPEEEAVEESGGGEAQQEVEAEVVEPRVAELVPGPIEIDVNSLGGHMCTLEAQGTWTVLELKAAIEKQCSVAHYAQSLICNVLVLQDDMELGRLGFGSKANVLLLRRSAEQTKYLEIIFVNAKLPPFQRRSILQSAPEEMRSDRVIVLEAVCRFGSDLQYASAELQADPKVALAAWAEEPRAGNFIAESLRSDRDFALEAVSLEGFRLGFFAEGVRLDREVVLAALRQNGMALRCLDPVSELLRFGVLRLGFGLQVPRFWPT